MSKRIKCNGSKPKNEWFDKECFEKRTQVREALHRFRQSNLDVDRDLYVTSRREYKKMLASKQKDFKQESLDNLMSNLHDSRIFWKQLKQNAPRQSKRGNISNEQWLDHFKKVFESDTEVPDDDLQGADLDDEDADFEYVDIDALDADITEDEVIAAIKNLKDKKAAGPDGLIPEIFKHSSHVLN